MKGCVSMQLNFKVGNDNGNSEQDIFIDNELIQQPNVNVMVESSPFDDEMDMENTIANISDYVAITIDSESVTVGTYLVGVAALNSGYTFDNMQISEDMKFDVEMPIINTLGNISAIAVKRAYENGEDLSDDIKVVVDMSTALPINQYSEANAKTFAEKFTSSPHKVTFHLGKKRISLKIEFDFVKVYREGTPGIFALQKDEKGKFLDKSVYKDFAKEYDLGSVDGKYFTDKRILHVDIGDGTSELAVTEGSVPDPQFVKGINHGAGYAIENSIDSFAEYAKLPSIQRQYYSEVLKGEHPKYHDRGLRALRPHLIPEVKSISQSVVQMLNKLRNDIDIVAVYGGGSILMKDQLLPKLKKVCKEREIMLLYIEDHRKAVVMTGMGLNIFVNSKIFEVLKSNDKKRQSSAEVL